MELTKTNVYLSKAENKIILANGSATFDDEFFVKFTIMNGKTGPYVIWPTKKGKDEKWYPDAGFIVNKDDTDSFAKKNEVENNIIKEYNKILNISPSVTTKEETKAADAGTSKAAVTVKVKNKPKASWDR